MTKVSDLFVLEYGHSLELNRLEQSSDSSAINFVGRAATNNGVTARVKPIAGLSPAASGTISVALGGQGGAGVAFLQPRPYYCGRDVMVLKPKEPMSEQEKLWWVTCITANSFRFGFGRQANKTLKDLQLPDRFAMPSWVSEVKVTRLNDADRPASSEPVPLSDASDWGAFRLGELFDVRKGKRLTKLNMRPGTTPFIGAIDHDNGVAARINQPADHPGNTITINYNGAGVAEAFYQPVAFCASDDVNVLYPKNFALTPLRALFLVTILRQEKYRFSYGRKWHAERMRESRISLPLRATEIDWEWVDRFMRSLRYSSGVEASPSRKPRVCLPC